jgi:RNA polymerase sigma-70 factor (ECF subfamily)
MGTAASSLSLNVTHITAANNVPPQFGELYQRYADVVFKSALRVTGSAADAEDVLQTVFLRLLNRGADADPWQSPDAYFRRAATNAAIDVIRRRSSRAESPVDEQMTAGESSPLDKERLRRAIAALPPRDAELFVLRYVEGISNTELAEMFQMERTTVGTRLHRIRQSLQESLQQ